MKNKNDNKPYFDGREVFIKTINEKDKRIAELEAALNLIYSQLDYRQIDCPPQLPDLTNRIYNALKTIVNIKNDKAYHTGNLWKFEYFM